ncbi:MAG: Wzt carbohydrate-binding domain-containing protein, partial [Cyclobacteriaceae bacterium]
GDAEFQKKAIGKMQDVSQQGGRTVLFVSHNMAAVQNLCKKGVVMVNGSIGYLGGTENTIQYYLKESTNVQNLNEFKERKGNGKVQVTEIKSYGKDKNQLPQTGKPFHLEFLLENRDRINLSDIRIDFRIDDQMGQRTAWFSSILKESCSTESYYDKAIFCIDKLNLNEGIYYITTHFSLHNELLDWVQNAYSFEVAKGDYYGTGKDIPVNQAKILVDFNIKYK